ncbi:hypothetical protein [Emticicia sp. BO119]|uniref:hypothetical protein n=1 Tax=Emticicia sp. BO119 TaxID=2757768 RepID=UPI0015F0FD9A|nr:hypothetical protein [Emticicia sp. BO119]MBA4853003.1 hypothetical protein [Emticicia sp. BO119]
MKKVISYICLAGLCTFLLSCENKSKSKEDKVVEDAVKEIKVVEDASSSSFGSRYNYDVVNELYKELLKEDKALTDLEAGTNELLEKKKDTDESFNRYDSKSQNYYHSAQSHLNSLRDSVLKQKYSSLILKSQEKYSYKVADLLKIIASSNLKTLQIEDLRKILKLTTTLAYIEKYQDKAKPDKEPFNDINKELRNKEAEIQKKIIK